MARKKSLGTEIVKHFQSGVSYIIPLVVASGLLTSLAVAFGGLAVWDTTDTFLGVMRMIGHTGLKFIVPMIAAYVAFSAGNRPALAPGFICGLIANEMGTGFLGGMAAGIAVGYLTKFLMKNIKLPDIIASLKAIMIVPTLTTFLIGLLLWYVIGAPIRLLTESLTAWLNGMSGANGVILAMIIGCMMAFDMGGPVNKIAYAFGTAAFTQGNYAISTAMVMAIGMPPFIMFLATLLNKKLYTEEELENSKTAIFMGLVGITEGTIPFALNDPLTVIPSIMAGSAVTCGINAFFNVTQATTLATFMAIPFASNIVLYLVAVAVGGLFGAFMVNFLKKTLHKDIAAE